MESYMKERNMKVYLSYPLRCVLRSFMFKIFISLMPLVYAGFRLAGFANDAARLLPMKLSSLRKEI